MKKTAALYARVSTTDQTTKNQLRELRTYAKARGWTALEYADTISGSTDSRPALDALLADARRRRIDVVVVWRLDRLGRNLRHLLTVVEEFTALGIAFVSLGEGIDCTTPAGKLQLHVLGALAEFERDRIRERIRAGIARARAEGTRIGRRRQPIPERDLERVAGLSVRAAAKVLQVPPTRVHFARKALFRNPAPGRGQNLAGTRRIARPIQAVS